MSKKTPSNVALATAVAVAACAFAMPVKTELPGGLVMLQITPAGEAQLDAVRQRRNDWLADRLARLSPDDRAALADAGAPLLKLLECEP